MKLNRPRLLMDEIPTDYRVRREVILSPMQQDYIAGLVQRDENAKRVLTDNLAEKLAQAQSDLDFAQKFKAISDTWLR